MIELGEWLPDLPNLENPGSTEAKNVYPSAKGYEPFGQFAAVSGALAARVLGATSVRNDDGVVYTYAGTADYLYRLEQSASASVSWSNVSKQVSGTYQASATATAFIASATAFVDAVGPIFDSGEVVVVSGMSASANNTTFTVSATASATTLRVNGPLADETASATVTIITNYPVTSTERWQFLKWKNTIQAWNGAVYPQTATIGTGNFSNLTRALKARYAAVVRDFVMSGYTYDSTDGYTPYRVRWCAINDPTDWTVSSTTQADYQDLPGASGQVMGIAGGEYGIVVCQRSVWRFLYVGLPTIFQADEVVQSIGTECPYSVIGVGDRVFWYGQSGFMGLFGGTQLQAIGAGKVDKWFLQNSDSSYRDQMYGAVDTSNHRVAWAFHSSAGDIPDMVLIYDYGYNRWSYAEIRTETLFEGMLPGFTLESLESLGYSSIESIPWSLDANIWKNGSLIFSSFDEDHKFSVQGVNPLDAVIETAEARLSNDVGGALDVGRRSHLRLVRPMVDGHTKDAIIGVQVGYRNRQEDDYAWTSESSVNVAGDAPVRVNARYVRVRLNITGSWRKALGVEGVWTPEGTR